MALGVLLLLNTRLYSTRLDAESPHVVTPLPPPCPLLKHCYIYTFIYPENNRTMVKTLHNHSLTSAEPFIFKSLRLSEISPAKARHYLGTSQTPQSSFSD